VRLGLVRTWGRWSEPGAVQAAAATPVTSFQVVNRWLISRRHSEPDIRCRPGRKCDEIVPCAEQKRWAWPAEWNCFIVRSRTRVHWCESGRCGAVMRRTYPTHTNPPASENGP